MRTTIDSGGRIVVPKAMRDALHLAAGNELDISLVDNVLQIEVPATPMRLVDDGHGPVAVTDVPMPVLTTELVRDVIEQTRR